MADEHDQVSQRQRRANWVALKTLRQRPKVAGTLADGEPVYEVRGVRLVLRGNSPFFNRLVACERCGQDQAGVPVLSAADLDAPLRPMICTDCVRKAGVSSVWEPEVARPPGERAAAQPPKQPEVAPAPAPPSPAGPTLGAVEERLEAMAARVEQLGRLAVAQEAALDEGRSALAEARAELAAATAAAESRVTALELEFRQSLAGLTQLVEGQRVDINAIAAALGQARTEIQRVGEVVRQLAQGQAEAQQRATSSAAAQAAQVQAAVDQRLHQLAEQLGRATARIEALAAVTEERAGRMQALEAHLDRLERERSTPPVVEVAAPQGAEGAELLQSLEMQLQGASSRLAALSGGRPLPSRPDAGDKGASAGGD